MSNIVVEPYSRLSFVKTIGTQVGIENVKDYSVHFSSILIAIFWTLTFILLSFQLLKRRDL